MPVWTAPTIRRRTPRDTTFSGIDQRISQGYKDTLADSLSGKIYDPFAAGTKEALARNEATQRASTANQIAGAGLSGTGLGTQVASGTENQIRQNRFDSNISIEQAKNTARQNALGEARSYGTGEQNLKMDQNRFALDVDKFKNQQGNEQYQKNQDALDYALQFGSDDDVNKAYSAMTGKTLDPLAIQQYRGYARDAAQSQAAGTAGTDFAAYVQGHLDLQDADESTVFNDPTVKNYAQKLWNAQGNSGEVPAKWALDQIKAIEDPRLTNEITAQKYEIQKAIDAGSISAEEGKLLQDSVTSGLTMFLTRDENGKVVFDYEALNEFANSMNPSGTGNGTGSSNTASYSTAEKTTTDEATGKTTTTAGIDISPVFNAIEEGKSFDTDKYDGALTQWATENKGKTVTVGGLPYTVERYTPSTKAGEKGKLVLKDADGKTLTYEGTESDRATVKQQTQNAALTGASLMTGGVSDIAVDALKGNWGQVGLDLLTLGTGIGQIYRFLKNRRKGKVR